MNKITEIMPDDMPEWVQDAIDEGRLVRTMMEKLRDCQSSYSELIMQVATKIPDESRHETALRYIQQAETSDNACAKLEVKDE